MKNKTIYITLIIGISIFAFSVISLKKVFNNTVATSGTVLSNKKICWGIKRAKKHAQPDLGSQNKALIEKYEGIAMGSKDIKNVYLTFDIGYEAGYTAKILDTLKANKVSVCFFITAHYLNTQPDLVKRMIDEGHIVGNHSPHALMDI